jgi:hypothetical protein
MKGICGSGEREQERVMGGDWVWSKHIIYTYENVIMKPIKNVQKGKKA